VITTHFAESRQRMFMFATAAFAGSATLGSMFLGQLMKAVSDWQLIFVAAACVIAAWMVAFFVVARRKLAVLDQTKASPENDSPDATGRLAARPRSATGFLVDGLFNRGAFWLLATLVLLDVVAAGNIVAWTARFFQTEYGVGSDQAGLVLAASSAGVFVGRMLMGTFVSGRVGDRTLLGTCYAAGILMYALVLVIPGYKIGLALVFLNGAFIAAQAPTMYAITSAKFGRRAATAIPLIDAIGIFGGFATPALVGALADRFGLGTVLWFVPALGIILVVIVFAWEILDRSEQGNAIASEHNTE
jgi:fucose permease